MDKAEFYKPLQSFINMVENNNYITSHNSKEIIESTHLEMLEIISKTKREGNYETSLEVLEILNNNDASLNNLFNLDFEIKYPSFFNSNKEFCNELIKLNEIKKTRIFGFKKIPKKIKNISYYAEPLFLKEEINLNELIAVAKTTDFKTVKQLQLCVGIDDKENNYISDEKFITAFSSEKIIKMIENWKRLDDRNFWDYKRFANAVRAERRLPFKIMNDHINIIKLLFPIIITTPEINFINWEKKHFDYAILD
ncbi:hypothetical protein [Spiroplasma endosymbiont of Labia minor]|uniref:hypothetical protein n=1 Tax=Spiroplasma endosymbiont of Labia minor TaxID=3066305 RepID=UPI0030CC064C